VNKRFAWVAGVLLALQKAAIGSAIKLQIILYVENWIDICQSFYSAYDGFAHVVDATRSKKYFLD